jgi:uncharacterized protein YjdB
VPFTKDFEITVTPVVKASSVTVTGKANSKTLNMSGQKNIYLTTPVYTSKDNTEGITTRSDNFRSIALTYTFTPTNVTYNDLEWTSTNPNVANVSSSDYVYGGSTTGTATLTGTTKDGSNLSVTFSVIVINGVLMNSTDRGYTTIQVGETKKYDLAIGPDGNGSRTKFLIRLHKESTAITWSAGTNYVQFKGVSPVSQLAIETYIDGDPFYRTQGVTPYINVREP